MTAVAATGATGCSGASPEGCFAGDLASPPELEVVHQTTDGQYATTQSDGSVPLILAPQGGMFLFIGARARNIDGCPAQISTTLRDETTSSVLARERHHISMRLADDGWLEPKEPERIASYANLPACPLQNASRSINDETYLLEVRLDDDAGRFVEKSIHIVPTCAIAEQRAGCECQCRSPALGQGQCGSDPGG